MTGRRDAEYLPKIARISRFFFSRGAHVIAPKRQGWCVCVTSIARPEIDHLHSPKSTVLCKHHSSRIHETGESRFNLNILCSVGKTFYTDLLPNLTFTYFVSLSIDNLNSYTKLHTVYIYIYIYMCVRVCIPI